MLDSVELIDLCAFIAGEAGLGVSSQVFRKTEWKDDVLANDCDEFFCGFCLDRDGGQMVAEPVDEQTETGISICFWKSKSEITMILLSWHCRIFEFCNGVFPGWIGLLLRAVITSFDDVVNNFGHTWMEVRMLDLTEDLVS